MKRILLVEPDAALRAELRHTLEAGGYGVADATSCSEVGRRLRRQRPDVLLVGLDDSADLAPLTRLLESEATPPVLALVTPRSLSLSLALLRRGVRAVLRKPFDLGELESELAAALVPRAWAHASPVDFITRDPATLRTLRQAEALATRNTTLLIEGESGTGKTLLAQRLHRASPRERTFRRIELDAPDETRSALRGAENAGTLLLPAVHRAHVESQEVLMDWLLRGHDSAHGPAEAPRIVATTFRPLRESVARGELRSDLAHRLAVITLRLPPLRERLCDLPALIRHFAVATGRFSEESIRCSPEALGRLASHPFRGNVRELENRVGRLAAIRPEEPVDAGSLLEPDPASTTRHDATQRSLKQLEREAIERSLARHGNNRTQASRELGISVRTLRNKLHRYGA